MSRSRVPRRALYGLIVTALLWASPASASEAVDTRAKTGGIVTTPQTISFAVTSGGPMVVGVAQLLTFTGVTSVTYNGTSLTLLASKADSANIVQMNLYGLANPATGTHNVVVTFAAAPTNCAAIYVIGTTGGDTTTGFRTVYTRNDSNGAGGITDTDSQSGDIVFHAVAVYNGSSIAFAGSEVATGTSDNNILSNSYSAGISTLTASGANTSLGFTGPPSGTSYAEISVAVIPAGGGGGTTPNTLTLTGAGPGQ